MLGGGSWWSKCLDDASTLAGLGEVGLDCLGWRKVADRAWIGRG